MNGNRRELILRVADGNPETLPILYHFDRFRYAEKILKFFIQNNITGQNFIDVYQNQFKLSWLSMGKWAVMRINKEKTTKAIIGGKDYRV